MVRFFFKSTSFCFFRICWYVAIFVGEFLLFINYKLDVHVATPPSINASGASQTTGGILCGQAHGNVFNHADGPDPVFVGPHTGKVLIYQSPQVLDPKESETSIKYEVTPQIKPVLKALAWRFLLRLMNKKKINCLYSCSVLSKLIYNVRQSSSSSV